MNLLLFALFLSTHLSEYLSFRWVLANSIMFNTDVIASITSISHHVAPWMIRFVVHSANFNERRLLTLYMCMQRKLCTKTSKKSIKKYQFHFSIFSIQLKHTRVNYISVCLIDRERERENFFQKQKEAVKQTKKRTCGRFRRGHLKLHETHRGRWVTKSLKQTCLSLHLTVSQFAFSAEKKETTTTIKISRNG